jgi:hypothetical protein
MLFVNTAYDVHGVELHLKGLVEVEDRMSRRTLELAKDCPTCIEELQEL